MDELFKKELKNAMDSYEKILEVTKAIESNLEIMGMDYDVQFGVEDKIIFKFIRNGVEVSTHRIQYGPFKILDTELLVDLITDGFIADLVPWKELIKSLQP
nr:MAG TPA: hypothetical protein [Caudoviricetes sp.]